MSEPDFKLYEEDLIEASQQIEKINKELSDLKDLVKSFDDIYSEQAPFIREIEEEIFEIKKYVNSVRLTLEKAEEYQYSNRKYSAFISGGLGSLTGGTIGIMLIPLIGPSTPLIATIIGGVSGIIYSLSSE